MQLKNEWKIKKKFIISRRVYEKAKWQPATAPGDYKKWRVVVVRKNQESKIKFLKVDIFFSLKENVFETF